MLSQGADSKMEINVQDFIQRCLRIYRHKREGRGKGQVWAEGAKGGLTVPQKLQWISGGSSELS